MCGICGIYQAKPWGSDQDSLIIKTREKLNHRGPDSSGQYSGRGIFLGHTRLSILDVSDAASQPFTDPSGRYTVVFNGEIYNYRELREKLLNDGIRFKSGSDTEVLLYWLIKKEKKGLEDLQGFFAFAFYDRKDHSVLLVRDRFGIKPLLWHFDGNQLTFASEMKALTQMNIPRNLDYLSLELYLQLNYIPAPWTIYEEVNKLLPGNFLEIRGGDIHTEEWYSITSAEVYPNQRPSYEDSKKILEEKLEQAVVKRLISDVPLGTFLSGGIDSSIITALAARHIGHLNTFSIGFKDQPSFDESKYARLVAEMHKTNHTEFSLTTDNLLEVLFQVLGHIDEPFADSSALAVYILSRETRKKVTVALSGDGADEMFAGYNKHKAEFLAGKSQLLNSAVSFLNPLTEHLPQSRNNFLANKIRQISRYARSVHLKPEERYWKWASISTEEETGLLLKKKAEKNLIRERKNYLLRNFDGDDNMRKVLLTDMNLVLPNDMLTKVDMMSMANSLEVRVPFLDHELVEFVLSLPSDYLINRKTGKKILKDTFSSLLPSEILARPKHGFEVPLLRWFRKELKGLICDDLLADDFIMDQNIFNPAAINSLKQKLFSQNPGDAAARTWALIVFQYWWKKGA